MPRTARTLALTGGLLCAACGGAKDRPAAAATATPPAAGSNAGGDASTSPGSNAGGAGGRTMAVPLTITATVGGARYRASGPGECQHTDDASIYEAPAALWSARFDAVGGDVRDLNLNVWQLKQGGTQLTLALTVGDATHEIATVQGPSAPTKGRGTGEVRRHDPAGTLVVDGADAEGTPVHVEVDCRSFTVPVAEGG